MDDAKQIEDLMKRFRQVLIFRGFIEAVETFSFWKNGKLVIGFTERIEKVIEQKRQELGVPKDDAFALYIELNVNEQMKNWIEEVSK